MLRRGTWLAAGLLVVGQALADEVILFNGKDMTGWNHFLTDKNKTAADVWSVEDGVIKCIGKPAGYIVTDKEFQNYVLTLEWRFPGKPGNSGVLLHAVGPDKLWPKSIEAQLHSGDAGDIWVIDSTLDVDNPKKRTQGRRTLNLTDKSEKPLGEWNKYVIVCAGDTITLIVNGDVVNFGRRASQSKGKIALQSEGTPIEFRNIKLYTLD